MKTFNKRGDAGETSLLYGVRVPKSDLRCEVYGTADEAGSALGLARALSAKERVRQVILGLQQQLFVLSAELATPADHYADFAAKHEVITAEAVDGLERRIEQLEGEITMPNSFIIPGATAPAAAIDLARTIVRRAERRTAELNQRGMLNNQEIPRFLNRAADLLFTLARYEASGVTEDTVRWK